MNFLWMEGKVVNVSKRESSLEIGVRFREFRTALGLTQDDVAKGGLRRTEISDVEGGRNRVTSERAVTALSRGLGVPPDLVKALRDGAISVEAAVKRAKSDTEDRAMYRVMQEEAAEALEEHREEKRSRLTVERLERRLELREKDWLAIALMAHGVDAPIAYRTAYSVEFDVGDMAPPDRVLAFALEAAKKESVEKKGKAVGDRPIRARQSPSGSMTRVELPDGPPTQPPKPR